MKRRYGKIEGQGEGECGKGRGRVCFKGRGERGLMRIGWGERNGEKGRV